MYSFWRDKTLCRMALQKIMSGRVLDEAGNIKYAVCRAKLILPYMPTGIYTYTAGSKDARFC